MKKKMKIGLPLEKKKKFKELMRKVNKISLKERKNKVIIELKNEFLDFEKLEELLLMDNTNEDLIYRYIKSLEKNNVFYGMRSFSSYMSFSKIKELQLKIFGNLNQGYRNFSYKTLLFELLYAILKNEEITINEKIGIINNNDNNTIINNQPFDLNTNLEAFYFHICCSVADRINKEKKSNSTEFKEYLNNLQNYINLMLKELNKYEKNEIKEKDDLKKFLMIIYSIINLDNKNIGEISQVPRIFNKPNEEKIKQLISWEEEEIKRIFGKNAVDKFRKKVEDNTIFYTIGNTRYINGDIEIPEKYYLYDHIIQNNVFKKYERKIIALLNIIYKSDLFKQLVRIIYKVEDNNIKYFFEENNFVEELWNNDIIFVPFKIKKVSGFSYKNTFKIFFSIYKIRHFDLEIEDEIFTMGAFIRVLIHESFGHLVISYIFYMFYANLNDYHNYDTPIMTSQMKELNKKNLSEYIGTNLAKIFYDSLSEQEQNNSTIFSEIEETKKVFNADWKKKLSEAYEQILGKEYANKLIKKLEDNPEIQISKINNEDNLFTLSNQIIDILISFISEEFDVYIESLNYKQEKYKEFESGNFVEFLLFNDFSQYMTLKESLFLLDENNYNTNFLKFRSAFKNLIGKNNDDFLKELNDGQKIFSDLFSEYIPIYEKKKKTSNDLNTPQSFRGNCGDNLNKKFEAFQCFNFGRDKEELMKKPSFNFY